MLPPTPTGDVVDMLHGALVRDPYRWLEDPASEETRQWVHGQMLHARSVLDGLPGRKRVQQRLEEAMAGGLLGVTYPRGRWRFFTRRGPGMDQAALYVRPGDAVGGDGSLPPAERTLIDPGPMRPDGTVSLDWWVPSADGELVCFGLSEAGSEDSTLRLLRTAGGEWLDDAIDHCRLAAVEFVPGGEAVLYTRHPEPGSVPPGEEMYHRHVWRHVIGDDPAGDEMVFGEELDKTDFPSSISCSADGRWTVVVVSQGWERTAVFLRDGDGPFRPIFEGLPNVLQARFVGDRLVGVTDFEAPNRRLVEIDPYRPDTEWWRDLLIESENVLVDAWFTATRIVAHHLVDASSRIRLYHLDGTFDCELDLPPFCTAVGIGAHHEADELFLALQSFTWPTRVYVADPSGRLTEVARLDLPPGFDPIRYPVRQRWFESKDGTRVPMFLVGRQEGQGPTVLTGYGGFNISRTPEWTPRIVPFLEAGGLFALPNLRGGGEFGRPWHLAGMRDAKQNVFDDFLCAAEWLIDAGLTSAAHLGIEGGSNGGLLVGAAMTQRPDLFGCVVCRVPLLDMVRYERFKVAQLWSREYGTAADAEQFGWLFAYSPYHRVRDGVTYPPTLITTAEEDARVDPMHARKMAARLQAAMPDGTFLLRVEQRAGHGMGKPVSKVVPEEADIWSFVLAHITRPDSQRPPPA